MISGNRCLPEGTLVHTTIGLVPIEDITINHKVMTSEGAQNVNAVYDTGYQQLMRFDTEIGSIMCTQNHALAVYKDKKTTSVSMDIKEVKLESSETAESPKVLEVPESSVVDTKTSEYTEDMKTEMADGFCDVNVNETDYEWKKAKDITVEDKFVKVHHVIEGIDRLIVDDIHPFPHITNSICEFLGYAHGAMKVARIKDGEVIFPYMSFLKVLKPEEFKMQLVMNISDFKIVSPSFEKHMKKILETGKIPNYILQASPEKRRKYLDGFCKSKNDDSTFHFMTNVTYGKGIQSMFSSLGSNTEYNEYKGTLKITDVNYFGKRIIDYFCPASKLSPVGISTIHRDIKVLRTYDIGVENKHEFVIDAGILTHNSGGERRPTAFGSSPERRPTAFGSSPSLRAGTKVLTSDGIYPIEQLVNKFFKVRNVNARWSDAHCRLSGKNKRLYKITLSNGKCYYSTAEHKWAVLQQNESKLYTDSTNIIRSKMKMRPKYSRNMKKYVPKLNNITESTDEDVVDALKNMMSKRTVVPSPDPSGKPSAKSSNSMPSRTSREDVSDDLSKIPLLPLSPIESPKEIPSLPSSPLSSLGIDECESISNLPPSKMIMDEKSEIETNIPHVNTAANENLDYLTNISDSFDDVKTVSSLDSPPPPPPPPPPPTTSAKKTSPKHKTVVMKETLDLEPGMTMPYIKTDSLNMFGDRKGTYTDGFCIGLLYSSPTRFVDRKDGKTTYAWAISKYTKTFGFDLIVERWLSEIGYSPIHKFEEKEFIVLMAKGKALTEKMNQFGIADPNEVNEHVHGLPQLMWTGSEDFRKGFINAFYSMCGRYDKGANFGTITTHSTNIIEDLWDLFGFYGISSTIKRESVDARGAKTFPVLLFNVGLFSIVFNSADSDKQKKLSSLNHKENSPVGEIEIISCELTSIKEDVYDIVVYDNNHMYSIPHCLTGNCAS